MGGLKGVIIDGANNQIVDLYAAFEITQKTVYFDLGNANADIQGACRLLRDIFAYNLSDEVMTRIAVEVDPTFFDRLIAHPKVKEFWQNTESFKTFANMAQKQEDNFQYREFVLHNVLFRENPAVVPFKTGPQALIAENTGHAYPEGTLDSHSMFIAPPDDINELDGSAASEADWIHITEKLLDHGEGIELKGQMNALPIWKRPKLLIKVSAAAGVQPSIYY